MKKTEGWLHRIEWSNSYTEPPSNAPRVLAEVFTLSQDTPAELESLRTVGGGYSLTLRHISPPSQKQLSPEALASVRRKRLERRVRSKVPLFADFYIEQAIAQKPEFYDGKTDEEIQRKQNEVLAIEVERYLHLTKHVNKLFVFGEEPSECKEQAKRVQAEISAIRAAAGSGRGTSLTTESLQNSERSK